MIVSGLVGFVAGAVARALCELARYAAWSRLEDEVEDWKASPRGRVHSFLDGLTANPSEEG
jgi:hypothetical protein